MPEVRVTKGSTDGWIVRRMAEIENASRTWPAWVHSVRVSPQQLESGLEEKRRKEEGSLITAESSKTGGEG